VATVDLPTTLAGVRHATQRLLAAISDLDDEAVRRPSALPGWSRAHVLTHVARHGDAQRRVADAASRGELADPYPGGAAGRVAEIHAGAVRDAAAIRADVSRSARLLEEAWRQLPDTVWDRPTRSLKGLRPLSTGVCARWVEVEVHHVDLAVGYCSADWPADFVAAALPYVLAGLPGRAAGGGTGETWTVHATDSGDAWHVAADRTPAVVRHRSEWVGTPGASYEVGGSGAALLAWLLGRGDGRADLSVPDGTDPDSALALPAHFPFP
jgi:maleylpyruvate isomerase